MAFIQTGHQIKRHYGGVQRHRLTVEQTQTNKVIDRRIGVNHQRGLLRLVRKAQLEMDHDAGNGAQMLPGFCCAEVVAAGKIPLRELQEIFADKRPLPLTGIDQPFHN